MRKSISSAKYQNLQIKRSKKALKRRTEINKRQKAERTAERERNTAVNALRSLQRKGILQKAVDIVEAHKLEESSKLVKAVETAIQEKVENAGNPEVPPVGQDSSGPPN